MHELKELETALKFIEDNSHYYSGFRHVVETCIVATELKKALWNCGEITDEEMSAISRRIEFARKAAIDTHKEWVVKMLKHSETQHTVQSLCAKV